MNLKKFEPTEQQATLLSITPDRWKVVERAAKVSHDSDLCSEPAATFRFVRNITKMGHETPLEFVHLRFHLFTDRGVANELTRHRVGVSFVQRSTRYCDEADTPMAICPFNKEDRHGVEYGLWEESVARCFWVYERMLAEGVPRQVARSVLPLSLATELDMDVNLRAMRTIYKLRAAKAAHPQMRELIALMMLELPEDVREIVRLGAFE